MAQNKNQHYVPKCHFRPFSLNGEGKCISLYNHINRKLVPKAPVAGQCARSYYYGDDLFLEKAFQGIEGAYATAVRNLTNSDGMATDEELSDLKGFTLLQTLRTEHALRRVGRSSEAALDLIFNGRASEHRPTPLSRQEILAIAMNAFVQTIDTFADLKTVICKNETPVDFLTSDNPAIHTNRYHIQKLRAVNFGVGNAGITLILPLTPRFAFIAYDGHCYMIPDKIGNLVKLSKSHDVESINSFQFMYSMSQIYFSGWRPSVGDEFDAVKNRRIDDWFSVQELFEHRDGIFTAKKELMKPGSRKSVIHTSSRHPIPAIWPSFLKWRNPIRVNDTKTGAGILRYRHSL
jgi:hypothetical protein